MSLSNFSSVVLLLVFKPISNSCFLCSYCQCQLHVFPSTSDLKLQLQHSTLTLYSNPLEPSACPSLQKLNLFTINSNQNLSPECVSASGSNCKEKNLSLTSSQCKVYGPREKSCARPAGEELLRIFSRPPSQEVNLEAKNTFFAVCAR